MWSLWCEHLSASGKLDRKTDLTNGPFLDNRTRVHDWYSCSTLVTSKITASQQTPPWIPCDLKMKCQTETSWDILRCLWKLCSLAEMLVLSSFSVSFYSPCWHRLHVIYTPRANAVKMYLSNQSILQICPMNNNCIEVESRVGGVDSEN